MPIDCPKCGARGGALEWYKEFTISGPIASIKCVECAWVSPIVVDGRKRLTPKGEDEFVPVPNVIQFDDKDFAIITRFYEEGGNTSDIANILYAFMGGKVTFRR